MKEPPYSFDLQRIFFGDLPVWFLAEVVFRTLIIYLYTLLLVRLLGKRGLGQLSAFDFVIVIALGSAVGDPMFYDDVPLVHTMVVITVVVLLQRALGWITERSARASDFIDSKPRRLVHQGVVDHHSLREERLESEELFAALRVQGVQQLGEVQLAYIEPSGQVSVLREPEPSPGRPLMAVSDPDFPEPYRARELAPRSDLFACKECGRKLRLERGDSFPARCQSCDSEQWLGTSRGPYAPPRTQEN